MKFDARRSEYLGTTVKNAAIGAIIGLGLDVAIKNYFEWQYAKENDEKFEWQWLDKEELEAALKGGAIGSAISIGAALLTCSNDKLFENAYGHLQLNKNFMKKTA